MMWQMTSTDSQMSSAEFPTACEAHEVCGETRQKFRRHLEARAASDEDDFSSIE